ncbi:hypothetical protein GIB67_020262 [Kingdonia uniflora]|uniref:Protein SCAR n=1 Tax=Kingdonia uniflora TaxID=39325 RepID=A0A7J7P419_9MAGN|nr:hypothetical protein GIB67_020262 [Kingdonia uniflora]
MPLTRYQIRNEYSLADPELYRAADKNDPEALLEGVAMAGLVGLLRQLGDLAEFAAEIFHGLHEEVMATSARGHALMIRVQQVEADFPSVEKALLSQTTHLSFLRNAGVDWHPKLRMDQNLVTQGELPRFVMESYEECRGPPRLFLLDKFDIAGAGTCLKRYSDPSFFRAQFASSEVAKKNVKRDKRTRKSKKKSLLWRNGETPEVPLASHSKLEQLLMEERKQSENNVSMHRVKLKQRQSNSSLLHSTGKNYMERFLESHSLEGPVVFESSTSPQLKMEPSNSSELVPKFHVIYTTDPVPSLSTMLLEYSSNEWVKNGSEEDVLKKFPETTLDTELENVPSTFYNVEYHKESGIDADGYRSDDIHSEMENYMDALTTMDSEMETDTESRLKIERSFFDTEKKEVVDPDTNEGYRAFQSQFSDINSNQSSITSDERNGSFKRESFSLSYSDARKNLDEKEHPSTETFHDKSFNTTSENIFENGDVSETRSLEYVVKNGTCKEESEIQSYASEFGEASSTFCVTGSTLATSHVSPEETPKAFTERLSPNVEEDDRNIASDFPPVVSQGHKPVEVSDCFNLNLVHRIKDGDSSEEMVCIRDAEDSPDGNIIEGELNPQNLVASTAEAQLNVVDMGHCGNIENHMPTGHKPDNLQPMVDCLENADFEGSKFLDTADEFSPDEMESEDVGIACFKVETICNNLIAMSDLSDCEMKDGAAPDEARQNWQKQETSNASNVMGSNYQTELEIQPVIDSADYIKTCNPELGSADDPELSNGVHDPPSIECTGKYLHTDSLTLSRGDKHESESKQNPQCPPSECGEEVISPSNQDLLDQGDASEPGFEIEADHFNVGSFHEVGEIPMSFNCQLEDTEFPNYRDIDPCTSSLVEEMPPLPPLPPMQWRIGKLPDESLASGRFTGQPSINPFLPFPSLATVENAQEGLKLLNGDFAQSLNPFLSLPATDGEKSQSSLHPVPTLVPVTGDEKIQHSTILEREITELLNSFTPLQVGVDDKYQQGPLSSGREESQPSLNPFATSLDVDDMNTLSQPLSTLTSSTSREKNFQQTTLEKMKDQHSFSTLEVETPWQFNSLAYIPTVEDLKRNGTLKARLALPRDPLIEAVASHDKSKLRKVPELVRPLDGPKVDERDSLLQQIRTKSFNLKPAALKRPNIQGPKTNFKVAAILEKANAIRQALAGSDDDDENEDSWSDA